MKNESLRALPSKSELADNATDFMASLIESLPDATHNPEIVLLNTLARYAARRFLKFGNDIFAKVVNIKKDENLIKPTDKLVETLKFLDDHKITDKELLETLKNLHALTFSADTSESDDLEIYLLIERLRELKGIEISIILACYNIYTNKYTDEKKAEILKGYQTQITQSGPWCIVVSRALELPNGDYVSIKQNHLEDMELITPRSMNTQWTGNQNANFVPHGKFRLTDSGYRLAEFIEKGEALKK